MPTVRVGIVVDRDSGSVGATGQYRLIGADGAILAVVDGGRTWSVQPSDQAGRLEMRREGRLEPIVVAAPVAVRPERSGDHVVIGGRRYRGEATVLRGSAGVTVVNRVPMESYLLSVVALELGFTAAPDRQAVMAQAIAARTYAQRYRGRRQALGFDVFPTDADQVYSGVEAEKPEVTEAVLRTQGVILTYRGEPIQALFHSTCGWATDAAGDVFQNGETVPYLRGVSDRSGSGGRAYYCSISPLFRWREEWDGAALNQMLSRSLPQVVGAGAANLGRVTNLEVGRTTRTGRVAELVVVTTSGRYSVPHGRIREVLRPSADRALPSTMFQLHPERRGDELVRVVAAGAGFGHGVGMCQFGAVGRSRAGQDARRILSAYYPGTTLTRIY
jgi:stage II sporulation protein D